MKALLVILLLCFANLGFAQEYSCSSFLEIEKDFSERLPMKVDEITTLVEFSVNCETKIVKYIKHLSVERSSLASGFQQRKQRQYLNVHCNKQGLASHGWSSADFVYDRNMGLMLELKATPALCASR